MFALATAVAASLSGCGGGGSNNFTISPVTPAGVAPVATTPAANCTALAKMQLPNATALTSKVIPAGSYTPPGSNVAFDNLPEFCLVTAKLSPVAGSSISIETWLPTTSWNGRYQQVGNHGFGGALYWSEMAPQLRRGYATGATDDGHSSVGFDVSWAINKPEAVTDFASRAVHELASKAKMIIAQFYGRAQNYAYFQGCSDGGREGMKAAQMFPDDFNGIIAGGAGQWWTRLATEQLAVSISLKNAGIQGASGAAILQLAQKSAIAACDGQDGVVDGLISDPRRCNWSPTALVCKEGQDPATCITAAQASALSFNNAPLVDPVSGEQINSGMAWGSEFDQLRFGYNLGLAPFGVNNYQIAYNNPSWDGSAFDLHADFPVLDSRLASINATAPDLTTFKQKGGKLIQWNGWADAVALPGDIAKYYDQVVSKTGQGDIRATQGFYRLFMLPNVGHCGSGPGPDNIGAEGQTAVSSDPQHDVVSALEAWVEKGTAPDKLIASKFTNDDPKQGIAMQRPVCPYPSEAVYAGTGDANSAASFVCQVR
jgi:feruloyl esterase